MSIRSKIVLFVSLLIMGLILVISLITEHLLERDLKGMVQEEQLNALSRMAADIGQPLQFRKNVLISAAAALPSEVLLQPKLAQHWLEDRIVLNSLYDHFIIVDARGRAIADWPHLSGRSGGDDYSQRDWFRNTLASNGSIFSKPRIGQFVRKPIVVVTVPLHDKAGRIRGVLAGIIDLTKPDVLGALSKNRFGKSGYFQVLTNERIIVADPDPARMLKPGPRPGENPALDRALAGFEGTGEGRGADGKTMLFGFKRIQPTGWILMAALPAEEALQPISQLRLIYWSGALLFMLLAAFLINMLIGTLLRPLTELRKSMDSLRLDDIAQLPQLPLQGSGELATIANSFNLMVETIRQRTHDLHDSEQKLRDITASLGFGVYALDAEGRLIFLNPAAESMLGWSEPETLGQDAHALFHHHKIDGSPYPVAECPVHQSITRGLTAHLQQDWLIRRDGTPLSVEIFATPLSRGGKPAGAVAAFQDVSSRLWAESRIQRQATLDGLTGLVNRRLFMDRLSQAIYLAHRNQQPLVLLMLDLDGFKLINDNFGHAGGDQLLRQVARRLTLLVRQSDTVARLGGDEFAMLLPDSDAEAGQRVGQKILDAIAQPYMVDGSACSIGVSIGMAAYPADATEADTLLIAADSALYAAKATGKHCLSRAQPVTALTGDTELLRHHPLIEWTDDYLVGIEPLDQQHRELTQHINAIEEALTNGISREAVKAQCDLLHRLAKQHFRTEEALMDTYGLAGMAPHKIAHHALLAGIDALRNELLGETPYLALPQMRDWLLDHIQHEDMPMAEMLKKHGHLPAAINSTMS